MNPVEDFQKLSLSDKTYDSLTKNHQPYVATFELTPKCNFRCIHCYLGTHREETRELSYEQIIHIIDQLRDAGVIQLALTGGECLLREDFCKIYQYAKEQGFIVSVFSNLSVLSDEVVELFREFPPFSVEVSLYGASEETYKKVTGSAMFKAVIDNVEKLYKNGINLSLKTPFIIQNIEDKKELEGIAKRFGKELRIGMALSPTIDQEQYTNDLQVDICHRFLCEASKNPKRELGVDASETENPLGKALDRGEKVPLFICNPGVTDVFVDFQGKVCPCIGYRSKGVSIFEKDFDEIWKSFRYLKEIPAPKDYKCVRCESRYFCSICVGEQDEVYKDMCHIPSDVCAYSRARKMYFIDKMDVEDILKFLKKEVKSLEVPKTGSKETEH